MDDMTEWHSWNFLFSRFTFEIESDCDIAPAIILGTSLQPLQTLEGARRFAQAQRRTYGRGLHCEIHLSWDYHYVQKPPLQLGVADANTTIMSDGWSGAMGDMAIISAGVYIPDHCWKASRTQS